ncbi:MAG: glutamate racemase, partial [Huintestinicola sp.]
DYMGSGVELVSSGSEAAKYACAFLTGKELLTDRTEHGTNSYYSSDSAEMFAENAHAFLGEELNGTVTTVDINELVAE